MSIPPEYDPRYLAGILFFNRRDFFEAHEVWEDLWQDCAGADRRFYQGLIQAAVSAYHGGNGNVAGAKRLFHFARKYMSAYPNPYLGLDWDEFWREMESACLGFLDGTESVLDFSRIPIIRLNPPPLVWPDPSALLCDDSSRGTRNHE
jgi:hypothetical protein